ncbi:MAG: fumarate hydratase [Solobacterium sp.]|nr:fumarate hydratase [Solobacterium sp.]
MREIDVSDIIQPLADACGRIAVHYHPDIQAALERAAREESQERAVVAIDMLKRNADIAASENIPLCQDTGMAIVWLKIGQDVHFTGGSLYQAVQEGVARGYRDNYLRASVVDDPLFERKNTKTNTPAVIYSEIVAGEGLEIEIMAKGFGSENKSAVKMLTPADGVKGLEDFVLDTIAKAGPNACPPFIVGVGVGGTFDSCCVNAKKALLRPISITNADPRYARLEAELEEKANAMNIGPLGLGGRTTVLKVQIEQAPTHIAGMPAAVNMCCHVCRHERIVL